MSISKEWLGEINRVYYELDMRRAQLCSALYHRIFDVESGWYNGHYHKDDNGNWRRESYPIPVISVKGFCDIEIQFDEITVTAKRKRTAALNYSYEKIREYPFEAYGVEDDLSNLYHEGQTIQDLKKNITESDEEEIFFSFSFPLDVDGKVIFEFVKLLRRENFYY